MNQNIAIEANLTPIKDFLSDKGFQVEMVDISKETTKMMDKYDALVVSGMNKDFMGIQDTNTKAVVIDAKGMTPEQVYNELQSRFE